MTTIDQDLKPNKSYSNIAFVFLFVVLFVADQLTKIYAKDVFLNNNFAFSLPLPVWLMYSIYFVVLYWLIQYFIKNFSKINTIQKLAFVLVLAGAFSNVMERLILGHVRDFIYITLWGLTGIYNLADGYILLAVLIFLCYGLTTNEQNLK